MSQTQEPVIGRFEAPEAFLADLGAEATAALVSAAADVVLVVDGTGIIRDMALGSDELLSQGFQDWIGKPWVQTVTVESRPKVEAMLKDAKSTHGARWRQVTHAGHDGPDLPVSYSVIAVPSPGRSQGEQHTVAFGRDLRSQAALQQRVVSAQMSMERDYWRLRHVETRYRLLFQAVSEPVLVLDAATDKLEEANPAAYELLGDAPRRSGWTLADSLDPASVDAARERFAGLRANGRFEPLAVRLAGNPRTVLLSATLFREETASHFLVRLNPESALARSPAQAATRQTLAAVIERAPDAFVVTDPAGRILTANRAFLDLAQLASEDLARGESLERWLGRAGVDLNVLISNLRQRNVVRLFATRMRGEYGSIADVEISAVSVAEGDQPCLGFTIRDIGRRLTSDARSAKELPRSVGQMKELVGRMPLKDIVRDTTDLIEQLCIEAALELTGDNRASAAEMLGLSRQSLYVKLRRFNIGDDPGYPTQ